MFNPSRIGALALAGAILFGSVHAYAASDAANLVDRARITIDDLKKDQEFGNAKELMQHTKAVLIVPSLIKGGFFVGGEGGEGVLLTRAPGDNWSYPAFYTMASASFGLQIGLEQSELVLFIQSDRALKAFMRDEFKVGAEAGLAVVTLGSSAEVATTSGGQPADIVVWASSSGAYAGITLNGSIIKPRASWNASYYGHPESVRDIVTKRVASNPGADGLRMTLATVRQ
jgi:lipid-binding SYLF domain-containing protein